MANDKNMSIIDSNSKIHINTVTQEKRQDKKTKQKRRRLSCH